MHHNSKHTAYKALRSLGSAARQWAASVVGLGTRL